MKTKRNLLLSWAAAALFLAPAFILAPSAAAKPFSPWENVEVFDDSPARAFLRAYGKFIFYGIPALAIVIYILILGPMDVLDAFSRTNRMRRYGGFGSDGGFGGRPNF